MTDPSTTGAVHVPTTWAQLIKNPVAMIIILLFGSGVTFGGVSMKEWAAAAQSLPEAVEEMTQLREEVAGFRTEMRTYGVCLEEPPEKPKETP